VALTVSSHGPVSIRTQISLHLAKGYKRAVAFSQATVGTSLEDYMKTTHRHD
jgi:hypothetical protein